MASGMPGAVDGAIKELFKAELSEFTTFNEATSKVVKAVEDRLDSLVLRIDELDKLPARIDSQASPMEDLATRLKAVEDFQTERLQALVQRVALVESNADGVGGLQQLWERLDGSRKEFDDLQLKAEQGDRADRELRGRLDRVDQDMLVARQQVDDLAAAVKPTPGLSQLPEDVKAQSKTLEDFRSRIRALENFETNNLMAVEKRLGLVENNADGVGGLRQVWEKLEVVRGEVGETKPAVDQSSRIAKEAKSRTDAFDLDLTKFRQQSDELSSIVRANDARVNEMGELTQRIDGAQIDLESRVDQSYEKVRGEVTHEIEELEKRIQLQAGDAVDKGPPARDPKNLVSYAMQLMSSIQADRKQQRLGRDMITIWKEQTWVQSRQRLGIFALKKIMHRKLRDVFVQGVRHASVVRVSASLREEFQAKLPDVGKILDESGLRERCDALERDLGVAQEEKASNVRLDARLTEQAATFEGRLEELRSIREQIGGQEQRISALALRDDEQDERLVAVDALIDGNIERISGLDVRLLDFAQATEVQTILRDVLLIWNSIKTVDATKADKKDVDSFAVESSSRERQSTRRYEELSEEITVKVRQETLQAQEKWTELDGRLDESSRQFRHWEQMWDKLAGSVEDLVMKIASIQMAADTVKPQQHANRPSSRPSSRGPSTSGRATLPGRAYPAQALASVGKA